MYCAVICSLSAPRTINLSIRLTSPAASVVLLAWEVRQCRASFSFLPNSCR